MAMGVAAAAEVAAAAVAILLTLGMTAKRALAPDGWGKGSVWNAMTAHVSLAAACRCSGGDTHMEAMMGRSPHKNCKNDLDDQT